MRQNFLAGLSVQFSSVAQSCPTPCTAARQASLSITNSRSSLELTSIKSVMPSSHLILCRPLFLLPPIPPIIRVFSNESTLRMRWPKAGLSTGFKFLWAIIVLGQCHPKQQSWFCFYISRLGKALRIVSPTNVGAFGEKVSILGLHSPGGQYVKESPPLISLTALCSDGPRS